MYNNFTHSTHSLNDPPTYRLKTPTMMSFFRSYIAPLLIVLTFLFAMVAVSARIFLPSDMLAPAPIEEPLSQRPVDPATIGDDALLEVAWLGAGLRANIS